MPTRALRLAMKRQEGQALVLALLMMLVLSLAVLTTVNLGHGVHERVRLQNTSDAAAYSMAAMEARAFNFYAFANRAQASHYVSAMVWQSVLSFLYFSEAFLVDVYGVMKSLDPCARPSGLWVPLCEALRAVPYLGEILGLISQVLGVFRGFLSGVVLPALRVADPDRYVGRSLIPAHRVMNGVLAAASTAVMRSTLAQVARTTSEVIAANDPNLGPRDGATSGGALSACLFNRAHMREANGDAAAPANPFRPLLPSAVRDSDKVSRAKRAMGAVANASRFACDRTGPGCPRGWVTDRRPAELWPLPPWLGFVRTLLEHQPEWKWGQTRMLSTGLAKGRPWRTDANFIRDWADAPDAPMAMMAQGDNLGSDDLYQVKLGPPRVGGFANPFSCSAHDDPAKCWGDPQKGRNDDSSRKLPYRYMLKTSIWALNDAEGVPGGIHYRLAYVSPRWPAGRGWAAPRTDASGANSEASIGLSVFSRCVSSGVCPFQVWIANVLGIEDGNHPWPGVVPFSHFEPGQFEQACRASPRDGDPNSSRAAGRAEEFNQPSTWVKLRKSAAEQRNPLADATGAGTNAPALLNDASTVSIELASPGAALTLDDSRAKFRDSAGMNVVSRGQTYYHRPGNWAEMPNFFNPYWRPRLASVWQGRASSPEVSALAEALPPPLDETPQRFLTH